jgi:hypothetical protein
MTNDPIYLLKPVFNLLDGLIRDQGDRLYLVFVYVCLFVIGWVLSGGLQRRFARHTQSTATAIIVIRPSASLVCVMISCDARYQGSMPLAPSAP